MKRRPKHGVIGAIAAALSAGILSSQVLDGIEYSELELHVRSTAYWGVGGGTYTPPNCQMGGSIFFPGEPIPFRIEIINMAKMPQAVVTSATEPARALYFTTTWETVPV